MSAFGLVLLCTVVFAVTCSAQSLADAARRERERQRQLESKAVYSNEGAEKKPAVVPAATVPPKPVVPAVPVRDEKYWRDAFQKARENAKRADDKVRLLELKVNQLSMQLLNRSDIYNREYRIGPEIGKAQAELDAARKEAAAAKQKIADLEEDLRRSGGPPGWAR